MIAGLLLQGTEGDGWRTAILHENVLQLRSTKSAIRLSNLLRNRLQAMTAEHWRLVLHKNVTVSTHACLAATVKQSPVLADFLDIVVRDQYRLFTERLTHQMWAEFVSDCLARETSRKVWSDSTVRRMRSSVFQILQQAGYIDTTRSLRLQTLHIADEVADYLQKNEEDNVLRCIQVSP